MSQNDAYLDGDNDAYDPEAEAYERHLEKLRAGRNPDAAADALDEIAKTNARDGEVW
jgi:hypothetical protein